MTAGPDFVLAYMYPDLLRTYGDRGNVVALQRRAEWRGFSTEIVPVSRGDALPKKLDLIFIGGGADRAQVSVAKDLAARRRQLRDALEAGSTILGVCAGYQLLGTSYTPLEGGSIPGIGLIDASTKAGERRSVGRVRAVATLDGSRFELVGFENHAGRTDLGPAAQPLARVIKGCGNNAVDHTEGAVQGNLVCTYLHGPVLPANPEFADALLTRALARATRGEPLARLDDELERAAHARALERLH
jgi:CobQ-like glutamine amidotransferase family enzyme